MADAEDLKSSGDFSSWGFDSPPGHHLFRFLMFRRVRGVRLIARIYLRRSADHLTRNNQLHSSI